MSTIKDISKKCHVSISTVSRALNGYNDINEETKELVLRTAKELDYIPNKHARELVKRNSNHLVIITKALNEQDNLFQILRGLYSYGEKFNYSVSLFTLGTSIKCGKSYYKFCRENNIAGALLYGIHTNDPYIKELIDKKFPTVMIDCEITGEKVANISINNFKAAYEAVSHMINNGCKNIKTIQGGEGSYVTKERVKGYIKALEDNNIKVKKEDIYYGNFSKDFGEKTIKKIIKNKGVDGIFCGADSIAIGVYQGLNTLNINIPTEISVVGFGDIEMAEYLSPALSTIRQSMYNFGYEGGKVLDKLIKDEEVKKIVRLEHEFIKRKSVR